MRIAYQYQLLPTTEQKATMERWLAMLRLQYNWLLGERFLKDNRINLSKIGWVKLVLHRPMPDGFKPKTAIVSKKSDGWYVTITLVDESVPTSTIEIVPTEDNSIALDLGLEKFAAYDTGEFVDIPQHFRHSEAKLALLQQKAATRKKGSRAKKLLNRKIGRLHQQIARQRKQFHFETAKRVLQKAPVVFVEDLAVKNLSARCKPKQDENGNYIANGQARKSGLNKSIADAGWAQFLDILSFKAESAGGKVVKVNPKNTSQVCSNCLNVVRKTLKERWHDCDKCNLSIDRDTNSAILIKKLGLDVSLSIKRSTCS